jgi:hypothetical protein
MTDLRKELRKVLISIYATKDLKSPMVEEWLDILEKLISQREEEYKHLLHALIDKESGNVYDQQDMERIVEILEITNINKRNEVLN